MWTIRAKKRERAWCFLGVLVLFVLGVVCVCDRERTGLSLWFVLVMFCLAVVSFRLARLSDELREMKKQNRTDKNQPKSTLGSLS